MAGPACNLVLNGQHLGGRRSSLGLPTFNQTYFDPHFRNYDFTHVEDCNKNISFDLLTMHTYDSLKWDFGDPTSGPLNYSILPSVAHRYSLAGVKNVKVILYNYVGCRLITDTISKDIIVGISPPRLGADTTVCSDQQLILNAFSDRADSYLWNSGATTATISATTPGTYWVQVTTGICKLSDTIEIAHKAYPIIDLGADTELCENKTLLVNAQNLGASYIWQDGSSQSTYLINGGGLYNVSVNLNGCVSNDTIKVTDLKMPIFSLGNTRTICENEIIQLAPLLQPEWQLLWSDGSTGKSLTVVRPGVFGLSATNNCGTSNQTLEVKQGICDIFIPAAFTPNNDNLNDNFKILGGTQLVYFHLLIFNRYGQLVFESHDKKRSWDGLLKSQPSDQGVYIYLLEYKKSSNSKLETRKGNILLIR
ncbi:MAG: T9SS type B sorting domain-containing protein [Sphingobacteriales bacterium]|nr:MAG: T9SS type B sorting domain-containing protein [Sphingobacteriales bacterium]